MSGYNKFDSERYSEEFFSATESEHNEVMRLMAEEGYQEWSEQLEAELEAEAWRGSKSFNTPHGEILIKKACEHPSCSHFRCERKGHRMGGFEL
jgi:hypothetical protein